MQITDTAIIEIVCVLAALWFIFEVIKDTFFDW